MGCRKKIRKKLTCTSDRNKRVTLYGETQDTSGAGGGTVTTKNTIATVWASLRATTGQELLNAQVREQQKTYVMKVLYSVPFLDAIQIEYDDNGVLRKFRVEAAFDPNEDRQEIRFNLEEGGDLKFP